MKYLSSVYGENKKNYFSNLDVFIFPSIYKNEAEPLVIYEAAQYGSIIIGSEIGCMKEVIKSLNGLSYPISDQNKDKYILRICNDIIEMANKNWGISRSSRITDFYTLRSLKKCSLDVLLEDFTDV
jgi:glycosyltransferase involved in cell wall biosynthesis